MPILGAACTYKRSNESREKEKRNGEQIIWCKTGMQRCQPAAKGRSWLWQTRVAIGPMEPAGLIRMKTIWATIPTRSRTSVVRSSSTGRETGRKEGKENNKCWLLAQPYWFMDYFSGVTQKKNMERRRQRRKKENREVKVVSAAIHRRVHRAVAVGDLSKGWQNSRISLMTFHYLCQSREVCGLRFFFLPIFTRDSPFSLSLDQRYQPYEKWVARSLGQ